MLEEALSTSHRALPAMGPQGDRKGAEEHPPPLSMPEPIHTLLSLQGRRKRFQVFVLLLLLLLLSHFSRVPLSATP